MKINNKGFTLVEILAILVILGVIIAIMIPNVNNLIEKNKNNSYNQLIKSIESATKMYISDYRYNITLEDKTCTEASMINIKKVANNDISDSKIPIKILIDEGNLKTSKDGYIYNPKNTKQKLNINNSYIIVKYDCTTKDYLYLTKNPDETYNNIVLEWE